MIKGETIILITAGTTVDDEFGAPIESDPIEESIDDVLITPGVSTDIVDEVNLKGKHIQYTLSIPKGDTHDWTDKTVLIRGEKYKTVGKAYYLTVENVPLRWNGKVLVERYE